MIDDQKIESPQRSYVENPDGFLDNYTIEDALRDLTYNRTKVRQAVLSIFPDYPGFLIEPVVESLITDTSKLYFQDFQAIDTLGNILYYNKKESLKYEYFLEDTKYYIVTRIQEYALDNVRPNKNQNSKKYKYIIEEGTVIDFKEVPEKDEIIIGTVTYKNINESIVAIYSPIEKSKKITTVQTLSNLISLLREFIISGFINNRTYISGEENPGNIIFGSNNKVIPKDEEIILPALQKTGYIGNEFIDWNTGIGIMTQKKKVILNPGNIDFDLNINTLRSKILGNILKEIHIWGETGSSPNKITFWGRYRLTTDGNLVETMATEALRSAEQPEYSRVYDCLFIFPSNNIDNDGFTEIYISNNFVGKQITLFYAVI